jgi:regulator of protease activity HflC (stomatin/prohibitin superfamily)
MPVALIIAVLIAAFALFVIAKTAVVVPQQNAFVVERLGRFNAVLDPGFHVLLPFMDVIRYKHTLKEQAVDIPEQICITKDNVQVGVDGILYLKVLDPQRASYGIADYYYAITQLAQTALRSEIGKIDLDRTFEERSHINGMVIAELDKATGPWGVKVLRYEIKNITPPKDVLNAMEKQMRAEREKRAVVLTSEGERDAAVNNAEGKKQQVIKESEASRQRQINESEGQAQAIMAIADATAQGLRRVAEAIGGPGGVEAVQLRVAEKYVEQFGHLAKVNNTIILPATLSDVGSMIGAAMNVIRSTDPIRGAMPGAGTVPGARQPGSVAPTSTFAAPRPPVKPREP